MRRKALLSITNCQSSSQAAGHVSHETHSLIPDFLTTPLPLLKYSPSSTAQPGGKFCVNLGPEEATYTQLGPGLLPCCARTQCWILATLVSPGLSRDRGGLCSFLANCLACHTCQPLLYMFVCLYSGHNSPLHFFSVIPLQ